MDIWIDDQVPPEITVSLSFISEHSIGQSHRTRLHTSLEYYINVLLIIIRWATNYLFISEIFRFENCLLFIPLQLTIFRLQLSLCALPKETCFPLSLLNCEVQSKANISSRHNSFVST